jgi:hypothetical protein
MQSEWENQRRRKELAFDDGGGTTEVGTSQQPHAVPPSMQSEGKNQRRRSSTAVTMHCLRLSTASPCRAVHACAVSLCVRLTTQSSAAVRAHPHPHTLHVPECASVTAVTVLLTDTEHDTHLSLDRGGHDAVLPAALSTAQAWVEGRATGSVCHRVQERAGQTSAGKVVLAVGGQCCNAVADN